MSKPNYYEVLGVPIDASQDVIASAFRRLAARYHPDLSESLDVGRMKSINEAYEVLGDANKRQLYDRKLAARKAREHATASAQSPSQNNRKAPSESTTTRQGTYSRFDPDPAPKKSVYAIVFAIISQILEDPRSVIAWSRRSKYAIGLFVLLPLIIAIISLFGSSGVIREDAAVLADSEPASIRQPESKIVPTPRPVELKAMLRINDTGWGVRSLAFSHDSTYLSAGHGDGAISVFELKSGKRVAECAEFIEVADFGAIRHVAFADDSNILVAGGAKGKVVKCELSPGSLKPTSVIQAHFADLGSLRLSENGRFILTSGRDGSLRYWSLSSDRAIFEWKIGGYPLDVAFSSDGKLALASTFEAVYQFDLSTGNQSGKFRYYYLKGSQLRYWRVASLSCDGTTVAGFNGYKLQVSPVPHQGGGFFDAVATVHTAVFSPNTNWIFTGGDDEALMWSAEGGNIQALLKMDSGPIETIAVSADSRLVAAVSYQRGTPIQIFEVPNEQTK